MLLRLLASGLLVGLVCLLSLAGFVAALWLHLFDAIPILFYRGILIAALIALIVLVLSLWACARFSGSTPPLMRALVAILSAATAFSFLIFFHLMVPVSTDRSISVFMLASIGDAPQGLTRAEIEKQFLDTYVNAYDAFGRRIGEQAASGNLSERDGRYTLTEQGRRFVSLSRALALAMGTDTRFVYPNGRMP